MVIKAEKVIKDLQKDSFNEGFQAGWYAASKQVYESLKKPVFPVFKEESEEQLGNPFKVGSGQATVYDYMKANPGKKGKEIIAALDVPPKTVRNAFHRLKDRQLAINENGWRLLR